LPETARKLAALHSQHGTVYIAAPIFGRLEAAVAQKLWIPFAGPQRAKERVRPLLKAMGGIGRAVLMSARYCILIVYVRLSNWHCHRPCRHRSRFGSCFSETAADRFAGTRAWRGPERPWTATNMSPVRRAPCIWRTGPLHDTALFNRREDHGDCRLSSVSSPVVQPPHLPRLQGQSGTKGRRHGSHL